MRILFFLVACQNPADSDWTCIEENSYYGTYEYCCHYVDGEQICSVEEVEFFCIHNENDSFYCCSLSQSGDCWVIQ